MISVPLVPLICAVVASIIVLLVTPWYIKFLRKIELTDKDQNKKDKPLLPISAGIPVMGGFFLGLMLFIFIRTFFPNDVGLIMDDSSLNLLFASMTSVMLITFVGFVDDLLRKANYSGLKQWQKPLLTIVAAIPLAVVNAGTTEIGVPFFGVVNFGIIYPLILIPIGVIGASNMVNMLAGFNGLEAGLGIIYTGMLGLYAYTNERYLAALIALIALFSLIAFIKFNWYPARILPGDSLTYLLGAVIASIAIIGNIEKAALIVSIPFFIEFFLKMRSRFKAHSFGKYKDGKIISLHQKIYSIPHIFTRTGRFTEKQVVIFMLMIELIISSFIWVV